MIQAQTFCSTFDRPPIADLGSGALSFAEDTGGYCGGGRGAVARPRGVGWRTGEPVFFRRGYFNRGSSWRSETTSPSPLARRITPEYQYQYIVRINMIFYQVQSTNARSRKSVLVQVVELFPPIPDPRSCSIKVLEWARAWF